MDEGQDLLKPRVHPIYGDSVTVGISDGSTEHIKFPGSPVTWISQWLGEDREVYGADIMTDGIRLNSVKPGIGKMIAESNGYPSNVSFVTVPPQKFIQVLFAEACPSANEITYRSLASVVKNRIRLTTDWFHKSSWWGTDGQKFDFSPRVGHNLNGAQQIRAENANEKLAADQIALAFNHGYDCTDPGQVDPYARYLAAAHRQIDPVHLPSAHLPKYDMCVKVAGDAMLDLARSLSNDSGMWRIENPDPNYYDIIDDPTGGCFSFYSPNNTEWGDTKGRRPGKRFSINPAEPAVAGVDTALARH